MDSPTANAFTIDGYQLAIFPLTKYHKVIVNNKLTRGQSQENCEFLNHQFSYLPPDLPKENHYFSELGSLVRYELRQRNLGS